MTAPRKLRKGDKVWARFMGRGLPFLATVTGRVKCGGRIQFFLETAEGDISFSFDRDELRALPRRQS